MKLLRSILASSACRLPHLLGRVARRMAANVASTWSALRPLWRGVARSAGVCGFALAALAAAASAAPAPSAATPLTQEEFIGAVASDLTAHFNLEGELQLELVRPCATPDRLARAWSVQILECPSLPSASMLVRCRVLADGAAVSEATLILHAALWRDAWVAREPLVNGAPFDPSVLEARRVDFFRDRDALPAAAGDQNYLFARSVQPGRLLSWRDIARRPLVKRGAVVEVSATEGQLVLVMKALAMQNGAKGDAVTVRNLDSRKDFTAFVTDENRVQVRF